MVCATASMAGRAVHLARFSVLVLLAVLIVLVAPPSAIAATCASYSTQAKAQRAADTRDADGDGRYCESLPCPCAGPSGSPIPGPAPATKPSCVRTGRVQPIGFSRTKYPRIRAHYVRAVANRWPRILVVNRRGGDARRDRLLSESELGTMPGFDRDEYPPGSGADVAPGRCGAASTRSGGGRRCGTSRRARTGRTGSALGIKLRRFCDGQKFRYVFF